MNRRPSTAVAQWLTFGLLSLVWGSSYFWIKVGVDEGLRPFTLITLRLSVAMIALVLLLLATRSRLPRDPATLAKLTLVGVLNVALPFSLITWAEQYVGSALASILTALVPLFVIVFAALALRDEPFTVNRLGGLVIGFVGAVLLLARHLAPTAGSDPQLELFGDLALVLSSVSYAASGVFIRRFLSGRKLVDDPLTGPRTLRPTEIALPQNAAALVIVGAIALFAEQGPAGGLVLPATPLAWVAVTWLGLLGSAFAYLLFFRLLAVWGATRTALVTYVMPLVGIALGVVILREMIDIQVLAGVALVIFGIVLVNARIGQRRIFGRAPATVPD
jgi:drug/metabolite transporter (DMT)-like permease